MFAESLRNCAYTLVPEVHLYLQRFEIIRDTCLAFPAHPLASPLFEPPELFVDIHRDNCYFWALAV